MQNILTVGDTFLVLSKTLLILLSINYVWRFLLHHSSKVMILTPLGRIIYVGIIVNVQYRCIIDALKDQSFHGLVSIVAAGSGEWSKTRAFDQPILPCLLQQTFLLTLNQHLHQKLHLYTTVMFAPKYMICSLFHISCLCLGNIFNYSVHCVLTCLHKLCEQTICQHLHTSNKWYLFKNRLFWKLKPLVSSTIPDWSLSYSNIVIVTRRGWADKKRDYLGIFVKFPNNPFSSAHF